MDADFASPCYTARFARRTWRTTRNATTPMMTNGDAIMTMMLQLYPAAIRP